jgi:dienelactone hydrolase
MCSAPVAGVPVAGVPVAGGSLPRERRDRLEQLLGGTPHGASARTVRVVSRGTRFGYRQEALEIIGAEGVIIPALLTKPLAGNGPFPAVLYLHAHGHRYDIGNRELIEGRTSLLTPAYGEALAAQGIAALCLDMPAFGARADQRETERAKWHLWHGRTLFGAMLRDVQVGLDVLQQRDDIAPDRIGAFGLSMGATQAYWLAALDDRIKAVAHLCCFADLAWLVEHGQHDLHGIYMMVPGLLAAVSTGEIAASIAPRPQLCCVGLADPLTPPDAVAIAAAVVERAYLAHGAPDRWRLSTDPAVGHQETGTMRRLVLEHFARWL